MPSLPSPGRALPALAAATALTLAATSAAMSATAPSSRGPAAGPAAAHVRRACAASTRPGIMSCLALVRTRAGERAQASVRGMTPAGYGYGPAQLRAAYQLPSSSRGAGESVAVVDAYDDPSAVPDLAAYRAAWGLPACDAVTGAGCLVKVNSRGARTPLPAPAGFSGWATEESLDVDMVAAICPACRIYLVEASSPSTLSLGTAVDSAVRVLRARFVSNSYGGSPGPRDHRFNLAYYRHPGVAVVAASGDDGYGISYPAASPYVIAAGGTTLTRAPRTSRGWRESAWAGTGSGCAWHEPRPAWQRLPGCTGRSDNDVAAVADPATGVAVYDTYDQPGWVEVGGTSVSAPVIAAVFALAGPPRAGAYPAASLYAHARDLFDVTSGSNGSCQRAYLCAARRGYDGPTGLGTPRGIAAFRG